MRLKSAILAGVLVAGCQSTDIHIPSSGPPPIAGGTLLVTRDGRLAIASDPDRASLHVVDLQTQVQLHRIVLSPDDEPGRLVEDASGIVHVVLRRAGQVLTLDAARGTIEGRRDVCGAPRGIAVDGADLMVACATGELVRLPAAGGSASERIKLAPDLRDVVVMAPGSYLVSRFRSAEVLVVRNGAVVGEPLRPPTSGGSFSPVRVPTVAWRMIPHPRGALMLHQESTASQLGVLGGSSGVYYGGDCDLGVVRSVVTLFDVLAGTTSGVALDQTSLAVDLARDNQGTIYVAAAAEPSSGSRSIGITRSGLRVATEDMLQETPACLPTSTSTPDPFGRNASATGVAVTSSGDVVLQYRDPAILAVGGGVDRETYYYASPLQHVSIALDAGRAEHLGHAVFHEAAGTGATCASCHPEGGDDGHVWQFEVGARRTQTLTGGILETAPFHWSGDVADVTAVMEGTFVGRMGGDRPRDDEIAVFSEWMDALPALPAPPADDAAVRRGRELFERAECASCHTGPRLTNNQTVGQIQVPALLEVAYRAPYLHDGSAATLAEVVGGHQGGPGLTEAERADVVHYLGSL